MRYAMGNSRAQPGFTCLFRLAFLCPVLMATAGRALPAMSMRPHRPGHAEQQQVLRVDDQMRKALLGADAAALERILAEDFPWHRRERNPV